MNPPNDLVILNSQDYHRIVTHIKEISHENVRISQYVLLCVIQFYKDAGILPTREDLATLFLASRNCDCVEHLPMAKRIQYFSHLLKFDMVNWDCIYMDLVDYYHVCHQSLPDRQELKKLFDNYINFQSNTDEYEQNERVKIGVDIKPFLTDQESNEDNYCGLCQEILTDTYYKLPCGHAFHADAEACISSTVENWFSEHTKCPLCRKDMRQFMPFLEPPKN